MKTTIRLNGTHYHSLAQLQDFPRQEVVRFLEEWTSDSPHVMGHTSGSTGTPKAIRLAKQDMLASARITNDFFRIDESKHLLLCLSPHYIAGKMMIVRALLAGANLVVVPPCSQPLSTLECPIDFAAMVPMQLETILASPSSTAQFSRIGQVILGGAPLSPTQEERLQTLPTACFCTYGMTETVSHVALRHVNGSQRSSSYFALGEVHFETDSRDCLVIHAPHLQARAFVTNDVVRLLDARHFEWLGRYDNVINSGGLKFFPESIEQKIGSFIPQRFFVTSEPDRRLGERIVLVIEDSPWPPDRLVALQERITQHLSPYEVPKKIYFLPRFAETSSGKILRK